MKGGQLPLDADRRRRFVAADLSLLGGDVAVERAPDWILEGADGRKVVVGGVATTVHSYGLLSSSASTSSV
jgi:hypothetical protein